MKINEKIIDKLEDLYFPICRMWYKLEGIYDEIKWFFQRGKRGYSECDIWGLNDYLVDILIPTLTWLRDNHHGCPPDLWDNDAIEEDPCHKWKKILDEMVKGFKAYKEMDAIFCNEDFDIAKKKLPQLEKKFRKTMRLFNKWFFHLAD